MIPPGWYGSLQMRKIGYDTDFSPKTHVFIWKRPKNSGKNSEKLRKTQKLKKDYYLFHNLFSVYTDEKNRFRYWFFTQNSCFLYENAPKNSEKNSEKLRKTQEGLLFVSYLVLGRYRWEKSVPTLIFHPKLMFLYENAPKNQEQNSEKLKKTSFNDNNQ